MKHTETHKFVCSFIFQSGLAVTVLLGGLTHTQLVLADDDGGAFRPGNLLVSRSVYDNNPNNVVVGAQLPPNCTGSNCVTATADGTYPEVFNNAITDGSFGITSRILLDEITPTGLLIDSLEVPNSAQRQIRVNSDQMVTSFSSKSESSWDTWRRSTRSMSPTPTRHLWLIRRTQYLDSFIVSSRRWINTEN